MSTNEKEILRGIMRDLEWLITVIFKTTPSGFLHIDFEREDE